MKKITKKSLKTILSLAYANGWDNGFEHAKGVARKKRNRKNFDWLISYFKQSLS